MELREIRSASEVRSRVAELADAIRDESEGDSIVCVVIAEGARIFGARLFDELQSRGLKAERVLVRATRTEGSKLGEVKIGPISADVFRDRHVLLIDDIADEGRTLDAVGARVRAGKPRTLRIAVLVSKRVRRRVDLQLDYVAFELDRGWVVGMGMDLDGRFRELDHLAVVEGLD